MAQPYFRKTTLEMSASALVVGQTATATITLCNRCGQRVPASPALNISDSRGTLRFGSLSTTGNGVFTCTVTAIAAGTSLISVTLGRDSKTFEAPSITVTASAPPVASISVSPSTGTAGVQTFTVTSSATGGTSPYTFAVDFGDGNTDTGPSLTHTYATPGTKTITLTVTDDLGQTGTAIAYVTVGPALSATLSLSASTGTAGSTAFVATPAAAGGTGPYSFVTDWGDGLTSNGSPTSHTYAAAGTYVVSTTATDAAGSTAVAPSVVVIAAPATPALSGTLNMSAATGTAGLTVFTASVAGIGGTGPYTISVNWGDGTTTTNAPHTHTYATAGTKTITATITDSAGSPATVTRTASVTVGAALSTVLSLSGSTGTAGTTIFTAVVTPAGGTSPYTHSIDWGDSTTPSTGSTGVHTYASEGSYTATVTTTDAVGSTATHTRSVTISAASGGGAGVTPSWSNFASQSLVSGDRDVYVSSSTGSNSNDGMSSATPKLTINGAQGALALIRQDRGDRLRLKAGDTFNEAINWERRGRSAAYPTVLTSYDTGARPILSPPAGSNAWEAVNNGGAYVAIIGIDFYAAARDPANGTPSDQAQAGIRWYGVGNGLLIEDCRFRFFTNGAAIQGVSATVGIDNVTVRGCVFDRNYRSSGAHGQGVYFDFCGTVIFEDCVFRHNGWLDPGVNVPATASADQFSHNLYSQSYQLNGAPPVTFRRCLSFDGSSHGAQFRWGVTSSDNYYCGNAIGFLVGGGNVPVAGGVTVTSTNDIVEGSRDITGSEARALGWGVDLNNLKATSIVTGLIVTQDRSSRTNSQGISISAPVTGLAINNAVVWNWRNPITADAGTTYTQTGSYFGNYGGPNTPGYVDPNRTVARYNAEVLAGTGTAEAFIAAAALQTKANWNPALSAPAVNAWVRAGFATA